MTFELFRDYSVKSVLNYVQRMLLLLNCMSWSLCAAMHFLKQLKKLKIKQYIDWIYFAHEINKLTILILDMFHCFNLSF